jgi:hypothetical protein
MGSLKSCLARHNFHVTSKKFTTFQKLKHNNAFFLLCLTFSLSTDFIGQKKGNGGGKLGGDESGNSKKSMFIFASKSLFHI